MPDISSSLSKREVNARQNTYTKSEIDLKDGAIQTIAEAAQTTADAAEKKNQEQDQLIAELQKSSHSHSNQDVLDKTEQPYTTAERDKLAGLENYTHPTYAAHAKGFYKFASDGEGHVEDAENVTKEDITALGIPDKDTNTTYRLVQDGIAINMLGSDGSSSEVGLKPTITKRLYGWINHEVNTDDTGKIIIDAYLGASPVRWDSVLTEPTKVEVGYDVGGQVKALIADFANDILVHNVVSQNCSTTVTGKQNLVEGNANKVYGNNNLVGGEHNQITEHGGSSVVSGYGLYCDAVNQTVLGRYNAKDVGTVDNAWNSYYGKYVLIIGNGSDSNTGRSNAFAVDWDGNLWCGKDKTSLNAQVASKQDKLTAGTNITINGNTINAKDTTYGDATQSAHGLMTAADKKKLDGMELSKYLPLHGTADQSKALSNGSMRYGWCVNNAANANSGYRWFRIGTMTASKNGYDTETLYMHICNGNNIYGVIGVYTRTDSTGTGIENMRVSWLVRDSSPHHAQFKLVGIASSTGVKFELWCYTSARWYQTAYYVIADLVLTGGLSNRWVLETHGDGDAKNATTVGTTSVTDVDLSYAAKAKEADTLTDSGWVDVSNFKADISSFSQITTSFRKYGDIVFIRGRVQPKSNMTSISLCSTTSTSLTGITPNHPVKGVGVSTDGLTPFMVNITTSPANSVILKGSFSANKIYDFEFSYIK